MSKVGNKHNIFPVFVPIYTAYSSRFSVILQSPAFWGTKIDTEFGHGSSKVVKTLTESIDLSKFLVPTLAKCFANPVRQLFSKSGIVLSKDRIGTIQEYLVRKTVSSLKGNLYCFRKQALELPKSCYQLSKWLFAPVRSGGESEFAKLTCKPTCSVKFFTVDLSVNPNYYQVEGILVNLTSFGCPPHLLDYGKPNIVVSAVEQIHYETVCSMYAALLDADGSIVANFGEKDVISV